MSERVVEISRERISSEKLAAFYAEGGKRAMSFVQEVIQGRRVKGKKYCFDDKFLTEINRRILFYAHKAAQGQLRGIDDHSSEVDSELAVSGRKLFYRFYFFGRWLRQNAQKICNNGEDLIGALHIASEAHYGIVCPDLHPFVAGNGRTARVLVNGILTLGTVELRSYGYAIPPIPVIRHPFAEKGKIDPYIMALRQATKLKILNPLDYYIAYRWTNELQRRLDEMKMQVKRPNNYDKELIDKFKWRRDQLVQFMVRENQRKNDTHIPLLFPE